MSEKIKPIEIVDKSTNTTYVLEFSKNSVQYAEQHGFILAELSQKPITRIPELFHYAFRKNHKGITKERTDEIFERMKGLPDGMLERLIELYLEPYACLIQDDEAEQDEKNAELTVNF